MGTECQCYCNVNTVYRTREGIVYFFSCGYIQDLMFEVGLGILFTNIFSILTEKPRNHAKIVTFCSNLSFWKSFPLESVPKFEGGMKEYQANFYTGCIVLYKCLSTCFYRWSCNLRSLCLKT